MERDLRFDAKIIVVRENGVDVPWDGKIKMQIYNPNTMAWEAATGSLSEGTTVTTATVKTTITDQATADILYVGVADIGSSNASAVWQIKKVETVGNVTTTTYADGNSNFDNVWNNRATLTYA